jgi:hypothetical protein
VDGVDVEEAQVLGAVQDALEAVWGELVGEVDSVRVGVVSGSPSMSVTSCGSSVPVLWTRMPFLEQLRRRVMTSTAPLGIGIRSHGAAAPRKPSSEAPGPPQASTAAHNRARGVSRVCPTEYTPR